MQVLVNTSTKCCKKLYRLYFFICDQPNECIRSYMKYSFNPSNQTHYKFYAWIISLILPTVQPNDHIERDLIYT